jgi:hypothetical protein
MKRTLVSCLGLILVLASTAAHAQYSAFPEPTGYWSFDRCDGGVTWDAAVAPHQGQLNNGAGCASPGRFGSAARFDGVDDRIDVAGSSSINFDRITVAAWVYPQSTSGIKTIANKWYALDSWGLFLVNGSWSFAAVFPGGAWGVPVSVSAPATVNTWTHVAGVYDGSSVRLYLNGSLAASAPASGLLQRSSRPISIGNHPSGNAFLGWIDELKLYDRGLAATDVARLATPPSALGLRGLHLLPSQWTCAYDQAGCDPAIVAKFRRDLGIIHSVGNINTLKTALFTPVSDFWRDRQNEKLTYLASAAGNHVNWILRAWPTLSDCSPGANYYECGRNFAHNLLPAFAHIQGTLRLANVFIEVGNEPNHPGEPVFYDANPDTNRARYNDFFRGFYFGQQEVGYAFPLVYAGLTSGCSAASSECSAEAWYRDQWVRTHIQNYAAKVGVHVYWDSTTPSDWNGRLSERGGVFYRRVKNILAAGYVPAVSPHGLQLTEFNFNRATTGSSTATQALQFCNWWHQAGLDAAAGYWNEQTSLFVTSTEDGSWQNEYWVTDDQLATIRTCQ